MPGKSGTVHRAAENYKRAMPNCAVIYLDDKSAEICKESLFDCESSLKQLLVECEVPFKRCDKQEDRRACYAVNYLVGCTLNDPLEIRDRILQSFDRDITNDDVKKKRENTEDFLQKAFAALSQV